MLEILTLIRNIGPSNQVIELEHRQVRGTVFGQNQGILVLPAGVNSLGVQSDDQRDRDQRITTTNFLVQGLRHLLNIQRALGSSRLCGSIATPSFLIQIDLSALGINSLYIANNVTSQSSSILAQNMNAGPLQITQSVKIVSLFQTYQRNIQEPVLSQKCISKEGL
jgi:hypothetical protein